MIESTKIKKLALEAGFDLCGITPAEHLGVQQSLFQEWRERGYGDDLEYLHRNDSVRFDPSKLVDGARSVVVCALNYKNMHSLQKDGNESLIASYAMMRDYHKTIRKALKILLKGLQQSYPHLAIEGRVFVDSAPLLEKHLAQRAGLGWIGRQSLLITPQYGSFVLLGEVVLNCEVDHYDTPFEGSRCAECRACVEACPKGAINDNLTIDARHCISCLTVECDNPRSEELHGWIFGCEVCQSCCPYNQQSPISTSSMAQIVKYEESLVAKALQNRN